MLNVLSRTQRGNRIAQQSLLRRSTWFIVAALAPLMLAGCPDLCPPNNGQPPADDSNQPGIDPCAGLGLSAAENLRLFHTPKLAPTYELRWDFVGGVVPDQQFAVFDTVVEIGADARLIATVPASERKVELTMPVNTGRHRFLVTTIAGDCIDGPHSTMLEIDTAQHIAFAARPPHYGSTKRIFSALLASPTPADLGEGQLPVWSPDTGKIAFRSGDVFNAYIASADASTPAVLVSGAPSDRIIDGAMRWSPRSDRVAFLKAIPYQPHVIGPTQHHLYVSAADGTAESIRIGPTLRLSDGSGSGSYAWSHDGALLIFRGWIEGSRNNQIYLADSSGAAPPVQISNANPVDADAYLPVSPFSPDGSAFLFVAHDRVPDEGTGHYVDTLHIVDMATLSGRPLVSGGNITVTDWSPDGRFIGFTVTDDRTYNLQGSYMIDRDGSAEPQPIADRPNPVMPGPVWSPDGAWLAYSNAVEPNDPFDPYEPVRYELYIAPADDPAAAVRLTTPDYHVRSISWAPTADRLVVLMEEDSEHFDEVRRSFYMWRLGGVLEPVAVIDPSQGDAGGILGVSWSPDGSRLLVEAEVLVGDPGIQVGHADTFVYEPSAGGTPKRLDDLLLDDRDEWIDGATWSPLSN